VTVLGVTVILIQQVVDRFTMLHTIHHFFHYLIQSLYKRRFDFVHYFHLLTAVIGLCVRLLLETCFAVLKVVLVLAGFVLVYWCIYISLLFLLTLTQISIDFTFHSSLQLECKPCQ